jgi:hypothetical protein
VLVFEPADIQTVGLCERDFRVPVHCRCGSRPVFDEAEMPSKPPASPNSVPIFSGGVAGAASARGIHDWIRFFCAHELTCSRFKHGCSVREFVWAMFTARTRSERRANGGENLTKSLKCSRKKNMRSETDCRRPSREPCNSAAEPARCRAIHQGSCEAHVPPLMKRTAAGAFSRLGKRRRERLSGECQPPG